MIKILHQIEKLMDLFFAYLPRRKPRVIAGAPIWLVAHRGAHDKALGVQENTMAAFQRAYDLGCYGIEFDIHACADGVLVVNHDPTLKRLWGHDVAINTLSFDELRRFAPEVPSLKDVVDQYGHRLHLFVELKSPFLAIKELVEELQPLKPEADYHLLCLDETIFPMLTNFPKRSLLLVPVHNNVRRFCKSSLKHQYGGILGHYFLLTRRQIKQLDQENQLTGVGFVDSKFSLYRELNRGLSLFFTNKAARVADSIKQLREPSRID